MKTFKKLISLLLIVTMVIGLTTTVFAAENSNTDEEFPAQEWVGTDEHEEEIDLSGQEITDILGDGSDYQIANFILSEDNTNAEVSYLASEDATLVFSFKDENTEEEVYRKEIDVEAGQGILTVDFDTSLIPEFFWVDITLEKSGNAVSDVFMYVDKTSEYQEFLNATVDSPEFADNVKLDYGESEDGKDNFAVVKADVKVVYVESMDDVQVIGDDGTADLFGLMEENDGYILNDVVNEEVLDTIEAGDKVLIFPMDDINNARVLTVDTVEETASLFGEDGDSSVEITADKGETELDDYFEFIRLDIELEADTEDIDTSDADEDIEFIDEVVVDENAEETADLFDSKSVSKSASASLTAKVKKDVVTKKNGVTYKHTVSIKDTITLTAKVKLTIEYKTKFKIPYKLSSVTASSSLEVKNVFNFTSSGLATYKPDPIKIGSIPVGTVAGVTFSIPVYFTCSAEFESKFSFTATQVNKGSVEATYKSGKYSVKTTKSSSSTKEIESEAKLVIRVGIRADLKASLLADLLTVSVSSAVGVKITGVAQSINSTSTYRHRDVLACLSVEYAIYIQPSFNIKFLGEKLVEKKWSELSIPFLQVYVHKKANKGWAIGTGKCPYREYLIKYTVTDGKTGKAMSGVTIKEGGTTLGTTNSKGVASLWLSMRTHTLKLSKSGYNTGTSLITVSASSSVNYKLYKTGAANDAIFTMTDLYNITDDEWATFTNEETAAAAGNIGNTIIQIQTKNDLEKLAEFTARTDRSTANIKFMFNNATSSIDMSGDWTPIGTTASPFKGLVDGNKFTVSGLTDSLFGVVENAEIHDLTIEGATVSGTGDKGILADSVKNSKIYDVGIIGGSVSGALAGGIIGSVEQTNIINAFSTATVSGTNNAGGIAGKFAYTGTSGRMENVYAAGSISGSGTGAIAGVILFEEGSPESEEAYVVGVANAYFLEDIASDAYASIIASDAADVEVIAYSVTKEQATGMSDDSVIAEDSEYANTGSLLEALNLWYAMNGSVSITPENEEDPNAEDGVFETEIPESSPNDRYNHWFEDTLNDSGEFANGGCPTFGEKEPVYKLTVEYVYEDGSEASPTVVLFFTEGQAYDVDTVAISGFHTYEDSQEYKGYMPAHDLEYRVIYLSDSPYTGTMTELVTNGSYAAQGSSYSIASEDELIKFAQYVNAGKSTKGVTFVQTDNIKLSDDTAFQSAGTNSYRFAGTFEGQNWGIENLKTSLFGYTEGAKINQVSVDISIAEATAATVGGIVGSAFDTEITGCYVKASIAGSGGSVGGIVGVAQNTVVDNCTVEGTGIQGAVNTGGIAGVFGGGKIINTVAAVPVTGASGSTNAGGIAGQTSGYGQYADHAIITNSYATGNVSGASKNGGIVANTSNTDIANVYYGGTVTGGDAAVKTVGSNVTVENIWYKSGNTSAVSGATSFELSKADVAKVLEALNGWLTSNADGTYRTWSLPTEDEGDEDVIEPPVFGALYSNWIMAMDLSDGTFTCKVDKEDYPDSAVYIVFYTASGQMKSMVEASAGSNTFSVDNNVVMVKAFVMDANMIPMAEAVASN